MSQNNNRRTSRQNSGIRASSNTVSKTVNEAKLLDDLEALLKGLYKNYNIDKNPEDYFFIDDILNLEQFQDYTMGQMVEAIHSDGKLRFSVRGSKVRLKPPELNSDANVILSKKLSWILRHGAEKEGFQFADGGYIFVDDMLSLEQFQGISLADIDRVVNVNDKRRFELRTSPEDGRWQIRATQGHSVKVEGIDLRLITDPKEFPIVIHGTYFKNWSSIKNSGLKRMGRTHIHFACGEVDHNQVISGMRSSAEIVIYIDLAAAMKDGFEFFVSTNRVVLCAGDANGVLPAKYFKEVYQRRPRLRLDASEWKNND